MFFAALSVQKIVCGQVTMSEVLNNYGLVKPVIFTTQKMKFSVKDLFVECEYICSFMKKSLQFGNF